MSASSATLDFLCLVSATESASAALELSSADDLALWVNGRFRGFFGKQDAAWFDFYRNGDHAGRSIPVELSPGRNDIVLRVIGGTYASGGFFARLKRR